MRFSLRRDAPALALVVLMLAASALAWPHAPARIPVHWGISGAPDGWGGRAEGLLLLPAVALGTWALLLVLPRFDPGRANYALFTGAYATLRTAIVAFLALLHGVAISAALGHPADMGRVVAPATGLLFVVLGGVMGRLRPNWFVGIRTPWTLSSTRAWTRTHRVGGRAFIGLGIAVALAGLASPAAGYAVLLGGLVPIVVFLLVYSYRVWRDDPDRQAPGGAPPGPPAVPPARRD